MLYYGYKPDEVERTTGVIPVKAPSPTLDRVIRTPYHPIELRGEKIEVDNHYQTML